MSRIDSSKSDYNDTSEKDKQEDIKEFPIIKKNNKSGHWGLLNNENNNNNAILKLPPNVLRAKSSGDASADGALPAASAISLNQHRLERAIQTLRNVTDGGGGGGGSDGDGGVGAAHAISLNQNHVERAIQTLRNGVSPNKFPGNRRTRKHRPRKTRKRNRNHKTRKV